MNPSSASSETNCARSRPDLGADRHVLESSGFGVRPDLSLVGWRTGSGCLVVCGPSPAGSARRPGSARWSARPSVSRRQVLLFHASACDGLTPPLDTGHRQGSTQAAPLAQDTPNGAPLSRGLGPTPGFDAIVKRFDASAVVHTCSSSRRTPDPLPCGPFPRSLPTPALDENDTAAVWALRLPGEPGGPTSITSTARSTLTTFYIATSSLSGHTSQTCFSVRDVDHHRLLGDRGAEPLDLLPRRGHRRLLPGLTRPARHRRSQRALLGDPADVHHRRTVNPPPLGRLPLRRLPVNTCRYSSYFSLGANRRRRRPGLLGSTPMLPNLLDR